MEGGRWCCRVLLAAKMEENGPHLDPRRKKEKERG